MPVIHYPYGKTEPVELGEGRGDLRFSSVPIGLWDGAGVFLDQPVSYARIFAEQPWVAIAVMRLLTWSVRVPLKLYERTGETERRRVRPSEHPAAAVVAEPWERGFAAELISSLLGPMLVHGNSLMDIEQGALGRLRFGRVDWRQVLAIREDPNDPFSPIRGWEIHDPTGGKRTRSADDLMHIRWWSPLSNLGVSPLRQLRSTLTTESAALDWTMSNLANGARPDGVVEMDDQWLSDFKPEQRQQLLDQTRADLREAHSGPQRAGMLPVLPPGLTWKDSDRTTAVEAQLIEQRKVNREEVAAIYQVQPPMIGILDRATYSNIETARQMSYTDGLSPPLIMIEQAMSAHLLRHLLREPDLFYEFDLGHVLRGDRLKEIQAIREAIQTGVNTPNEGRAILNLPPSSAPGASRLWLNQNNLAPLDEDPPPRRDRRGSEDRRDRRPRTDEESE